MKKILIALTIITTALSGVRAASVFSDVFNYPDGSIVANSSGIWINNTGTAGTMLVSNQTLIVSTSRAEDIAHYFGSVYPTNGPVTALYSSYTIKCIGLPTAFGTYFNHFTGTNTFGLSGHRARVFAATTNNVAGTNDTSTSGDFYLYIVNSVGSTTNGNNQWTTPLVTNVTYTIVTKYVLATGASTLWVNPSSESDPSVTDTIPLPVEGNGIPTNGIVNISHYSFRQATGEGTMLVNNLKIGTAFSDVAGANTSPTISPIPNQNTPANTAIGPITFIIGDDSPLNGLILTKGSSNPALVPTNNIVLGGSGANRTVTITPASGQQGSSTITIFVSDGVNISSTSFLLRVGAPAISAVANQITYLNIAVGPLSFTVSDSEGDSLTVSQASSNPTLLPTGNVVLGGSGANRTVTLTPASGQTGVSTITLSVADNFNTNSTSFVLSVSPQYGVILTDDFNYTDFLQDTALQGADAPHASPWGHAGSNAGTNYDLLVINGAAQLSFERSEDLAAALADSPFATDSGVLLYASFSITFSNLPTPAGDYFVHFQDTITGSTFRDKIYASTTNAAAGFFRLGVANAANTVSAQFPLDLTTNHSYFVVTRYNTGTGESVLWVNPNNEYSTSAVAQDSTTAAIVGDFGLRQSSGIGISYLDNLVVGTAFGDVATITVVSIPLHIQSSGANVVLTWNDPTFNLQSSANVTGPYATVGGATSPFSTNTISAQQYFRLMHP
jgi:hypothetical protein